MREKDRKTKTRHTQKRKLKRSSDTNGKTMIKCKKNPTHKHSHALTPCIRSGSHSKGIKSFLGLESSVLAFVLLLSSMLNSMELPFFLNFRFPL